MKEFYYESFTDDFVESKNQDYKLKDNYKWYHTNIFYRIISNVVYYLFVVYAYFYLKFYLHVSIKNKKILKKYKKYFLYGNHTQPMGDVLTPALVCNPKRFYAIVSPANLGIPFIGKLLPMLGALPLTDKIRDQIKLVDAIKKHVKDNKAIVIYPEAHVWPYCTFIREFNPNSLTYPIDLNVPVFTMTTTYQKRKLGLKPKITVYIDGPFYKKEDLSKKENIQYLYKLVYSKMCERSKATTYEYYKYIKKGDVI